jgi:hypothetical protein
MKTYEQWLDNKPDDEVMRSAYANYVNETVRSGSTRTAPIIKPPLEDRVAYLEKELRKTIVQLEILKLKFAGELK